jgi:hypothetical protein
MQSDLEILRRDLDQSEREVRKLADALTSTQANWRTEPARWSVAQNIDHMARLNRLYSAPIQQAIDQAKADGRLKGDDIIRPGFVARWFIKIIEPPAKLKAKAVKDVQPPPDLDWAATVDDFVRSHDPVRRAIDSAAGLDLNKIRYRNPIARGFNMTIGVGLWVINSHDRRHLWQAEQVRRTPGFPAQ